MAVHRAVADLSGLDYLPERSGLRQRVPAFDPPELRDFLGSAARRPQGLTLTSEAEYN